MKMQMFSPRSPAIDEVIAKGLDPRILAGSGKRLGVILGAISLMFWCAAPHAANTELGIQYNGASVTLNWNSIPGSFYQVQARNNFSDALWMTVTGIVASASTTMWTDPLPLQQSRFYRLLSPTLLEPPERAPGEPCACTSPVALPPTPPFLYLFSGEFHYSAEDLRTEGVGLHFAWGRKYRSRLGPNTAQGNGWDFTYNIHIQQIGGNIEVFDGNTRQDIYCLQPDGTYAADQFFQKGTLSNRVFRLQFRDMGIWEFLPLDFMDNRAKISRIVDRNGNALTFYYDFPDGRLVRIADTRGKDILISYNGSGFIEFVTDFTGRRVTYAYYQNGDAGGSFGDLKSVTSPAVTGTSNGNDFPLGKTTLYTYSKGFADERLNHNLLTITDPKGQTGLRNFYSAEQNPANLNFDRVERQTWGNPNETMAIFYAPQTPAPTNYGAVMKTILNDRVGSVSEHFFDAANRCVNHLALTGRAIAGQLTTETQNRPTGQLRPDDPASFQTRMEWNVDSQPTRIVYPNGNIIENKYELDLDANAPRHARGNLRTRRTLPGPLGGDQTQIVETFDYASTIGGCCGFNFMTQYTDGRGNTNRHAYDQRGNRTNTIHRISSIVERFEYNVFGQMTLHVFPDNGNGYRRRDIYEYYLIGPQTGYLSESVVDAGTGEPGNETYQVSGYEYNAVGVVTRHVDPRGNETLFVVNALNQLVRELSRSVPSGSVSYVRDFFRDANNNVVRIDVQNIGDSGVLDTNAFFTTTNEFDILNLPTRVTQEINPSNNIVTEIVYDAERNRTLVRNGAATSGAQPNNIVQTIYDERHLPFKVIRAPNDPGQSTTQYDYDPNRNLIRTSQGTESSPRITTAMYDGFNRQVSATDAMGNIVTNQFDENGNLIFQRMTGEIIDVPGSAGNVRLSETTYTYDAMDRRIRSDVAYFNTETQAPLSDGLSSTVTSYNDLGLVIATVDDKSHTNRTIYDTASRPTVLIDPKGNSVTNIYDDNGNPIISIKVEKSDLGGTNESYTKLYTYDDLDRLIQSVDNVGNTNRFAYDSRNNLTLSTDARGNVVSNTFDGLNRLIQTTSLMRSNGIGSGLVTNSIIIRQAWDSSSRLVQRTDANTNNTTYVFDPLNRIVATVFADGTSNSVTFDAHDNPVSMRDGNGSFVSYLYDLNNRMTNATITPGPEVSGETTFQRYQFDGLSRLVRAEDDDSLVTRSYNSLSLCTSETLNGQTTICSYDGDGNKVACRYPGGRIITRTFDTLDRPFTIVEGGIPLATYSYVGPNRIRRRDYRNGTRTDYAYDGLPGHNPAGDFGVKQITATTHSYIASGLPFDARTYKWNRAGDKTDRVTPQSTQTFDYDSINRLGRSVRTPPGGSSGTHNYAFDGVGNRRSGPDGIGSGAYTMNSTLPEPADRQMNQYTTTPARSRSYDKAGNLTYSLGTSQVLEEYSIKYNHRNEMVQHQDETSGGFQTQYRYDALGRRIEKTLEESAQTIRFFYDGWQEIEEQNASGATLATYVYGPYIDEVINMRRGGTDYYFHADDQHNVVALTDAGGNLVERYEYDDYGSPSFFDGNYAPRAGSAITNDYLFNGRRFDPETGFYYFRHRYLDANAGRFTTRDPIGTWTDKASLGNAYTHVGNNPATWTDPMGFVTSVGGGIGGAGLSYDCAFGVCVCRGEDDCNDMFNGECQGDERASPGLCTGSGSSTVCICFPGLSVSSPMPVPASRRRSRSTGLGSSRRSAAQTAGCKSVADPSSTSSGIKKHRTAGASDNYLLPTATGTSMARSKSARGFTISTDGKFCINWEEDDGWFCTWCWGWDVALCQKIGDPIIEPRPNYLVY